ncbi:MAG: transposase [Acidimicrobiales bacterium]
MTTTSVDQRAHDGGVADNDNQARPGPRRRRFSAAYKARILEEYTHLSDSGAKGALLRKEGLYSSHIVEWRRAAEAGAIAGLAPKSRESRAEVDKEIETLRRRNSHLADQLTKHKAALAIQGKASELLAALLAESSDPETKQLPKQQP